MLTEERKEINEGEKQTNVFFSDQRSDRDMVGIIGRKTNINV